MTHRHPVRSPCGLIHVRSCPPNRYIGSEHHSQILNADIRKCRLSREGEISAANFLIETVVPHIPIESECRSRRGRISHSAQQSSFVAGNRKRRKAGIERIRPRVIVHVSHTKCGMSAQVPIEIGKPVELILAYLGTGVYKTEWDGHTVDHSCRNRCGRNL